MKRLRRKSWLLAILAISMGALGWWIWLGKTTLTFVEFRASRDGRPVFVLWNDSNAPIQSDADAGFYYRLHQPGGVVLKEPRPRRFPGNGSSGQSLNLTLDPGYTLEFPVEMVCEDGTKITVPFEVGVGIWQRSPPVIARVASKLQGWFPGLWTEPRRSIIWSEVVTPPE